MAKRVYVRQSQVQAAQQLVKRSASTGRFVSKSIKKIADPQTKVTARAKSGSTGRYIDSGVIDLPEGLAAPAEQPQR